MLRRVRLSTTGLAVVLVATAACTPQNGPTPSPSKPGTPSQSSTPAPSESTSASPSSAPTSAAPSATTSTGTETTPAGFPTSRSKLTWPFAKDSIWNTSIGSDAKYVNAGIGSKGLGVDTDWFVVAKNTDPLVNTYMEASFGPGRCAGAQQQQQATWHPELAAQIHFPEKFIIPDATSTETPNNSSAVLAPDGKTLQQFNITARCQAGGPLYGFRVADQDIYGDGIAGGHAGSAMSSIGGSVRAGELFGDQPIHHALKLTLWGDWLYFDKSSNTGFRWPATMNDGAAANSYKGKIPSMQMGSLIAIPPSVTADSLGINDAVTLKIFHALQDYGAYVVDDSGWDYNYLDVEVSARDEFKQKTGKSIGEYQPLQDGFNSLVSKLDVVSNNAKDSIGGGGKGRQPAAPPITD